jgi:thiamine pyrophosphokinase
MPSDAIAPDPAAAGASPRSIRALIVADGEPADAAALEAAWPGWADGIDIVIAADGGARLAERLLRSIDGGRRTIDLIVGDGDSLGEPELARFEAAGVPFARSPVAKDESDTELAVAAALARGATDLILVGAVGGRLDHTVANLSLLAAPTLAGRSCVILDPTTRITLLSAPAERELAGRTGDVVSLLPLGDGVTGVTTTGLAYPLDDEPLPFGPARGLSNVRTAEVARVVVRTGRVLLVETPATLPS